MRKNTSCSELIDELFVSIGLDNQADFVQSQRTYGLMQGKILKLIGLWCRTIENFFSNLKVYRRRRYFEDLINQLTLDLEKKNNGRRNCTYHVEFRKKR